MASINKAKVVAPVRTHNGAIASQVGAVEQLKRSVMACMLWEDTFYEDGVAIADRITDLIKKVSEADARAVLYSAKNDQKLRHMPLFLLCKFAEQGWLKKEDVAMVCTRPDDMTELLAMYWKDGKKPLPKQMVKGLQLAFGKFDEYQLAKYNRKKEVKLVDVLKITRPKPEGEDQGTLWKKLLNDTLATPDTWEVAISACKNASEKKAAFERLITEQKLGDLAFIRNLRKMDEVKVDSSVIKTSFAGRKWPRILPFQFVTSARYNPKYEANIETAMLKCLDGAEKIDKKVKLLVDVSGSMDDKLSEKSETLRLDVASGLAILLREICTDIGVYTFSTDVTLIPSRHGFALRDAINGQYHGGTNMWNSVRTVGREEKSDLMIVITDEQTSDTGKYADANTDLLVIINVASYKNGVGYGKNTLHISGWSENCVDFLRSYLKNAER